MASSSVVVNHANRLDCDKVFDLVNDAFSVEIGEEGVCYRNCPKFALRDQARKQLDDMLVLRIQKKILGCVHVVSHRGVSEISLLAVHPDHRGKGYGRRLMTAAESKGKVEKCSIGIASCRTDIIPFFQKLGYRELVTKSIDEMRKLYPDELSEKKITREDLTWKIFMKKVNCKEDEEDEDNKAYISAALFREQNDV